MSSSRCRRHKATGGLRRSTAILGEAPSAGINRFGYRGTLHAVTTACLLYLPRYSAGVMPVLFLNTFRKALSSE